NMGHQRQAKPRTLDSKLTSLLSPNELAKDVAALDSGDSHSFIPHGDSDSVRMKSHRHMDGARFRRILHGIIEQVPQRMAESGRVGTQAEYTGLPLGEFDLNTTRLHFFLEFRGNSRHQRARVYRLKVPGFPCGLHARKIEQGLHEPVQPLCIASERGVKRFPPLFFWTRGKPVVLLQKLRHMTQ